MDYVEAVTGKSYTSVPGKGVEREVVVPPKGVTVMSIPVGVPPNVGGPACHVNRSPASNVLGADMEAGCMPWNVFTNIAPGRERGRGRCSHERGACERGHDGHEAKRQPGGPRTL